MTIRTAHILYSRKDPEYIRGMDREKVENLKRIQAENRAEGVTRVDAAKSFKKGMTVRTADGRTGKVSSVNEKTGSIEVIGKAFRRPEWHAATALTKL